jgi:hypothetical protein
VLSDARQRVALHCNVVDRERRDDCNEGRVAQCVGRVAGVSDADFDLRSERSIREGTAAWSCSGLRSSMLS